MAFVVVQHLSPDFKSLMDELLARHTELPIHLVEDGMPVEADHVYLNPAEEGDDHLRRAPAAERAATGSRSCTLPIDVFFRSLAQDCGPRAVAIVLSGGGSDGSRGIRDVHEAGGLVIVQDAESAQFDGMPQDGARRGRRRTGCCAPQDMPRVLARARRGPTRTAPPAAPATQRRADRASTRCTGCSRRSSASTSPTTSRAPSPAASSAASRSRARRDIDEYVRRLKRERDELDVLYRDLLIGVTRFFRDERGVRAARGAGPARAAAARAARRAAAAVGRRLRDRRGGVLAGDRASRPDGEARRAAGEDLRDRRAPRLARAGDARASTTRRRWRTCRPSASTRYFIRTGDTYQVVPDLRQMVVFAQHNVIKDAPFTRVDLDHAAATCSSTCSRRRSRRCCRSSTSR